MVFISVIVTLIRMKRTTLTKVKHQITFIVTIRISIADTYLYDYRNEFNLNF